VGAALMKKLLLAVVTIQLAMLPCFADVIPTRRVESDKAAEQKVQTRLEQLGVSAQDAARQVRDLSPEETNYFAQDPTRVQAAAGLYWYEWVGGIVMLAALTIIIIVRMNNN
jgi:hypothetical protein